MRWHQREITEIVEGSGSSLSGLSSEEAEKRLEKYGPNELIFTLAVSSVVFFAVEGEKFFRRRFVKT
ncbi:MAG: cation-transporting P-type ATPase [Thermodesulfovibrionales bacterium]|nr:cation-transporting P-type ATPase [Thermodesulfovibrionales bacterium]